MLAIIIMIPVIGWFARTARAQGKSQLLWGVIGAASYFVPTWLLGSILMEMVSGVVVEGRRMELTGLGTLLGFAITIGTGIGCCVLARLVLVRLGGVDPKSARKFWVG